MKWLLLLSPFFFLACRPADSDKSGELSIASADYVVLTQKAITYQTDFELDAWAGMLSENVEYVPPEGVPVYKGRAAVLSGWKQWRESRGVQLLQLSRFTHLPVKTSQQLPMTGKAGVYVMSYCLADVSFADGKTARQQVSFCCHFDPQKRIDYYSFLFPADTSRRLPSTVHPQ